jgi:hypothetical protein
LVEYIQATVDENSEPEFASEEIALLNEYVANGGDIRDYIDQVAAMDYDDVDVSSTTNQRRIVEQNLRLMGYDDNRIRRTIARYEDADVLREEAEDALDILKGRAMEEREQLVIEQQREQQEILDMQQQIYEDVSATVQNIDSIRGIPIAKADRQKLMNYIFTVGSDGQTQYQRDYSSDLTKNLIESAYFTMKGDSIIKSAKSSAQSEAVRALREQLRTSSIKTKSTVSTNKGADMDALSSFARGLGVR